VEGGEQLVTGRAVAAPGPRGDDADAAVAPHGGERARPRDQHACNPSKFSL